MRDGIHLRLARQKNDLGQTESRDDTHQQPADASLETLKELEQFLQYKQNSSRFKLQASHTVEQEGIRDPSLGLPSDCAVKPKNRFLIFKPQIALRSEIDENAIVLLAVEEVSYREYSVLDELAHNEVAANVLNR